MPQLYLMSIVLNSIVGFLFIFERNSEDDSIEKNMKFSLSGGGSRLILGILTALTGLLKLFLPFPEKAIPVLGDLIPAMGGIVGGFVLLFAFYRENTTGSDKDSNLDRIGDAFLNYKKVLGFVLVAIALLHFFFYKALFL